MTTYKTLAELVAAYRDRRLNFYEENPLVIDNDSTSVDEGGKCVFEMHPLELLEQALDLLDIPHESV